MTYHHRPALHQKRPLLPQLPRLLAKALGCVTLCLSVACTGELGTIERAVDKNNKTNVSFTSTESSTMGTPTSKNSSQVQNTQTGGTTSDGGTSNTAMLPDIGNIEQDGGRKDDIDMSPVVAPFGELTPEQYARKVKYLLHGGVLTREEIKQLQSDPSQLRSQIEGWVETQAFEQKMFMFLQDSLQQTYREVTTTGDVALVSQIRGSDVAGNFFTPDVLHDNLEEMFTRTALKIIKDGRPFHEIATTKKWMMTTAVAMYLLAADMVPLTINERDDHTFYGDQSNLPGFGPNTPLSKQIEEKTWYVKDYERGHKNRENCLNVFRRALRASVLSALLKSDRCSPAMYNGAIKELDYNDWHEVTISPSAPQERLRYYDIIKIREAVRQERSLNLVVPRVGFFSTPAYFARWRSNVDNSFRVTTNQSLIVGLGESFEPEGFTAPLTQDGLGKEHAEPGTTCYGCHISLDPMRNYFARTFNADYYSLAPPEERSKNKASFGFLGYTVDTGSELETFGQAIASHPRFAAGWVQKLCMFANSKPCDPTDPEFRRIEQAFVDSNFNFKTLIVELFSSPLITASTRSKTHDKTEYVTSITRKMHLCHALQTRMKEMGYSGYEPCGKSNRLAVAIPADAWSRGATKPFQPATSSLFYSATVETFCTLFAQQTLDKQGSPFQSSELGRTMDLVVQGLMGLPIDDPKYKDVRAAIQDHYGDSVTETNNIAASIRSTVAVGCMSPMLTSVEF